MKVTSNEFLGSLVSLAYLGTLAMAKDEDFNKQDVKVQTKNHLYMEFFGRLSYAMTNQKFRDKHGIDIDIAVAALSNMFEDTAPFKEEEEEND